MLAYHATSGPPAFLQLGGQEFPAEISCLSGHILSISLTARHFLKSQKNNKKDYKKYLVYCFVLEKLQLDFDHKIVKHSTWRRTPRRIQRWGLDTPHSQEVSPNCRPTISLFLWKHNHSGVQWSDTGQSRVGQLK